MNNAILIQHSYPGAGYEPMLDLTRKHNEAYCKKYDIDFQCEVYASEAFPISQGAWLKIELIKQALELGYQYVAWLDADAMIIDTETDLRDAIQPRKVGACWCRIPQLNHWNVGVLYVQNSEETRAFINEWLASYPPPADGWFEQGVFNRMGKQSRVVETISDKWNATIDVNMVPDAVVLGFHGQGNAQQRYEMMKETFNKLFPAQEAMTQGLSEVTHG